MENGLLNHIDQLIEKFQHQNNGEKPLYVVLGPDERKEVINQIKTRKNYPSDFIVTTYHDVKLAEHPSLLNGKLYVSNELPETGS
jgi:hypothetical protein